MSAPASPAPIPAAAAFAIGIALYGVAAILATDGRARRGAALVVALAGLAAPYALPPDLPAVRATAAIAAFVATIRVVDLVVRREPVSLLRRLVHCFTTVDSFRLRRSAPAIAWRQIPRIGAFSAATAIGAWIALGVAPTIAGRAASLGVRWLGGLLTVYALSEVAYASLDIAYRAAGFTPPRLHRNPALARSVRDFWGRRWNRVVGEWFDARLFRPRARRGQPLLGMTLVFLVSTLVHAYITHVALGAGWALVMSAFFLIQGAVALVEGPLGVARWRPAFAHAWTIAVMTATSPLFCEPFLRVVGG